MVNDKSLDMLIRNIHKSCFIEAHHLRKIIRAQAKALRKYGRHLALCDLLHFRHHGEKNPHRPEKCTCGYDKALRGGSRGKGEK